MATTDNKYVKRSGVDFSFDGMMKNGFGIVTVMNANVYNVPNTLTIKDTKTNSIRPMTTNEFIEAVTTTKTGEGGTATEVKPICTIDTLKVANVTQEGPNKTVTGGQYSNPLIKFGKSARLEMQDALGRADAIEALGGATIGYDKQTDGKISALHFSEEFAGPKTIIGDSFFIDKNSGRQVPVKVIFYQFLPDSIFNLTQDSEGDATVFDMNGDLLTTDITLHDEEDKSFTLGLFYSIYNPEEASA